MAPPPGTLRVGRYFAGLLALVAVLYAIVFFPGNRHTPKLGIDLVGGIRVIFTAQTPKGSPPPTSSQMSQARQILEDRINGTGVTGSTVVVQGSDQLVVEIPEGTSTDVARLGKAAVLNFRGVMAPPVPVTCGAQAAQPSGSTGASGSAARSGSASPSASTSGAKANTASNAPNDAARRPLTAPTPTAKATPKASGTPTASATGSAASSAAPAAPVTCEADPFAALFKADPTLQATMPNAEQCPSPGIPASECKPYTALSATQKQEIAAALSRFDCSAGQVEPDYANRYYIACDDGKLFGQRVAFLLGHVIVPGKQIDSAAAQAPNIGSGGSNSQWTVSLTLGSAGADKWNAWTSKYNTQSSPSITQCGASSGSPCSNFVGFTLDGQVLSYPVTQAALGRNTQISGNFTQSSAQNLAQELNYGKLPLSFRADQNERVSATLGNSQLKAAFLAGGIGLILVVIYSLIYYRALGLVTIASLVTSAVLTYAMLVILGGQIGFTLDLAGIAGFIVALGITADSFVVFFERIKDEVHEGRSVRVAVPRAWVRARRTILSADTVSFLAAAILYFFASADVKGFAFTLGMSTILDLVVVFLFTHPLVSLLSRSRAFGSAKFTGLNAVRAGGIVQDVPERAQRKRSGAAAADATQAEPGAVAVLEREDEEPGTGTDEPDGPGERRRTTPQGGSAAERAAARRARMRGQSERKDEN